MTSKCCNSNNIKLDSNQLENLNWNEISISEIISSPIIDKNIEEINDVFATVELTCSRLIETPSALRIYKVAQLNPDGTPVTDSNGNIVQCPCDYIGGTSNGSTAFQVMANAEGTCLSGRKLIVEGLIKQKIIYTADVQSQSIHSVSVEHPFFSYIVIYPKFNNSSSLINGIIVIDPDNPKQALTIDGYLYSGDVTVDMCEEFCANACIEDVSATLLDPRTIFKSVTVFLYAKLISSC